MEYLAQLGHPRAVVGIGGHDLAHVRPPPTAGRGFGDGVPALLVFQLDVPEQLPRLLVISPNWLFWIPDEAEDAAIHLTATPKDSSTARGAG